MQQLSPELLKLLGCGPALAYHGQGSECDPQPGGRGDYEKQRFAVMIVAKISKTTQFHTVKKSLWVAWCWHRFRALKTQMK